MEHTIFSVLRLPGATRAFLPSLVGRLALAMGALAIVLAVHRSTGSFATAGTASGAFGFANVLAAPWRARAIDRWGQRLALTPLGLAQAAAFSGFAFAAHAKGTESVWFVALSIAIGVVAPPLGASMRIVWIALAEPGAQRTRALSLDAVADEVVFIIGPVIAATLATTYSPSLSLLAAAVAVLAGTLGLTTSRASGRLRGDRGGRGYAKPALRHPGFARVLVVLLGVGCLLGTIEIAAPALAAARHDTAASGWLLAALSVGSAIGGLIYGHVSWRATLGARMLALASAMGALTGCVAFLTNVPAFGIGVALIGIFLAPSIVTGYLAAERLVAQHAQTQASVWTNTALNLGAAGANAAAGALVAGPGITTAMLIAGVLALIAATCAPRARLRATESEHPKTDSQEEPSSQGSGAELED